MSGPGVTRKSGKAPATHCRDDVEQYELLNDLRMIEGEAMHHSCSPIVSQDEELLKAERFPGDSTQ